MEQDRLDMRKITFDRSALRGRGAFGNVYIGKFDRKQVAVKRILIPSSEDEKTCLKREESILMQLDSKYVVKLFYAEDDGDFRCFAMELCDSSLDKCFSSNDDSSRYPGPSPSTFTMLHQLAQGLHYIHSKNLVHRDIKPENVLISKGPPLLLKWADFGLSKQVNDRGSYSLSNIRGTKIWMAPEVLVLLNRLLDNSEEEAKKLEISSKLEGKRGNVASDLFSVGCFFFFLVAGGGIYLFGNRSEIPGNIIKYGESEENNPINLDKIKGHFSEEIILGLIKRFPSDRTPMAQVVEQLNSKKVELMEAELLNFIQCNESIENEEDMLPQFEQVLNEEGVNLNFASPEGLTSLLLLCKQNRYKCIKKLLNKLPTINETDASLLMTMSEANVNHEDKAGKNGLFWLVQNTTEDIVDVLNLLIEKKINVKHVDKNEENALFNLLSNYSGENIIYIIELLVENGINVKQVNRQGENVFFHLLRNNSQKNKMMEIVGILIKLGVDIKCINRNKENILYPLVSKYTEDNILHIIHHLLKLGVDARQLNGDMANILFPLIVNNNLKQLMLQLIELFLSKGVNVNQVDKDGRNVLFPLTSKYRQDNIVDIVKLLITNGINLKLVNFDGDDILFHLISGSSNLSPSSIADIIQLLIKENFDFKRLTDRTGDNILLRLVTLYSKENIVDIVKLLAGHVDVNHVGAEGDNVLFRLTNHNSKHILDICKFLTADDHKFKINYVNKNGENVLFRLLSNYSEDNILDVITLFIEKGIDLNNRNHRMENFLFFMVDRPTKNIVDILKLLLDKGPKGHDYNCVNSNGENFLFRLVSKHSEDNLIDIFRLLIEHKNIVDIGLVNYEGENILFRLIDHYSNENIVDIFTLLIDNEVNVKLVNSKGDNVLLQLVSKYSGDNIVDLLKLLTDRGCNKDHVDQKGDDVLFRLADSYSGRNMADVIQHLIDKNVDTNRRNKKGDNILFHLITNYLGDDIIKILELLVDNGSDVTHVDKDGDGILFRLIEKYKGRKIINIINLITRRGNTIVHQEDKNGNIVLFRLLDSYTNENSIEIIKLLMKNRIDINHINKFGNNILEHLALLSREDTLAIIELLVKNDVKVGNAADKFNKFYRNNDLANILRLF